MVQYQYHCPMCCEDNTVERSIKDDESLEDRTCPFCGHYAVRVYSPFHVGAGTGISAKSTTR